MKPRGPFVTVIKAHGIVEVWLGPPGDPESELVFTIDRFWLPSLIAALRAVK